MVCTSKPASSMHMGFQSIPKVREVHQIGNREEDSGVLGLASSRAYKLVCTRRALEKTYLNHHRQDQARATASNPPDPH
eukprot:1145969-Pelagomonas_calceolata.AAC.1